MNFNYSYKAFLIASLLVGNLVLLLVSVKLQKIPFPEEETVPIEYLETIPEEIQESQSEATVSTSKITTNTAYNEAEAFIREIENEKNITSFDTEEMNSWPTSETSSIDFDSYQKDIEEAKKTLQTSETIQEKNNKGVNKQTTISYSLKGRKAMQLKNPVYTCAANGKIVISITVNDQGKVIEQSYNKTLSTSSNGCLIEAALTYASRSKFNTKAGKNLQLGTITYVFPGQN